METDSQVYDAVVKWYDNKLKYGFVTILDTNEDIFVHYNSIKTKAETQYKTLFTGEYITTTLVNSEKGKQCGDIRGVRGGMLLCESNKLLNKLQMLSTMNLNLKNRNNNRRNNPRQHGDDNMIVQEGDNVISDNMYDNISA